MCKYCEGNITKDLPIRANWDISKVLAFIADGDNKKELVVCLPKEGILGIEINYCPICGDEINIK